MPRRMLVLIVMALAAGSLTAAAGTSTPTQATPAQAAPAPQTPPAPPPVDSFTYNPEGRRDPFVSLLTKGNERRLPRPGQEVDGAAGLAVDDLSVKGIVSSPGGLLAMVQGPDKKTYLVRQNDKLLDGVVKAITPEGLVILQDVNDPLSLVKQKEVRKMLHEEGK
jgi:type IV pilus assembly protein PilP